VHCFPSQAREERKSSLRSIASLADVDDEPLFCFETALKTCYWCVMVYQRKADGSRLQTHCFICDPDVSNHLCMLSAGQSLCTATRRCTVRHLPGIQLHAAHARNHAHVCFAHVQLTMRMVLQVKEEQDVNIETAMQLYQLEHFELVCKYLCIRMNQCTIAVESACQVPSISFAAVGAAA
jgi:hypothetical protein